MSRMWTQGEVIAFMAGRCNNCINKPVKHGKWRHYEGTLTCSVCHTEIYDDIMELIGDDVPRYCPNCGAKMDEVTE